MRRMLALGGLLVLSACGGGNGSPTGPSNSIPNVVGSYSGTATLVLPELNQSATCPASTSVTQSGSTVSIAPIVLRGVCENFSIPFGQATIDATGALTGGSGSTSFTDPSCGVYQLTGSGGFFGRELRLSVNGVSATCFNFNFSATMTR